MRIPLDPGGRSGVIRALVPVDLGAVGAKRRATSGSERSDGLGSRSGLGRLDLETFLLAA